MSTTVLGLSEDHYRSVTVTTLSALAGVVAGLVSEVLIADPAATEGLYVVAAFVVLQLPLLRLLGIDVSDFGMKDHLYVAFMVFSMWYVTWTIILTSNASL